MTPLLSALLVVGVIAAAVLIFISRNRGGGLKGWNPGGSEPTLSPSGKDKQLDMFTSTGQFDEFGVGRKRRIAPSIEGAPGPGAAPAGPPQKIIALLIAERDGTHIYGQRIHTALQQQGLQYGAKQIYHRLAGGEPVFSVASLLKPGLLDPAQASSFSTPGLSMFLTLPGPVPPMTAWSDMLSAAQGLAKALNAELYDMRRKPLTADVLLKLEHEVEDWARKHPMS